MKSEKPTFFLPKLGKDEIFILPPVKAYSMRYWEHKCPPPRFVEGQRVYCKFAKQYGRIERVWSTVPVNYGVRFEDGKATTAGDDDLVPDVLGQMADL